MSSPSCPSITVCEISLVFYWRCCLDICVSLKPQSSFCNIYSGRCWSAAWVTQLWKSPCGGALTHSSPRRTGLYSLMSSNWWKSSIHWECHPPHSSVSWLFFLEEVSQFHYYGCLGLDNSMSQGCAVPCRMFGRIPSHQVQNILSPNWSFKMFPDIAQCPWG